MTGEESAVEEPKRPILRVVKGDPSPAELAALIAVVTAVSAGTPDPVGPVGPQSGWADRAAGLRSGLHPGPGAWVASTRAAGRRTRADW